MMMMITTDPIYSAGTAPIRVLNSAQTRRFQCSLCNPAKAFLIKPQVKVDVTVSRTAKLPLNNASYTIIQRAHIWAVPRLKGLIVDYSYNPRWLVGIGQCLLTIFLYHGCTEVYRTCRQISSVMHSPCWEKNAEKTFSSPGTALATWIFFCNFWHWLLETTC